MVYFICYGLATVQHNHQRLRTTGKIPFLRESYHGSKSYPKEDPRISIWGLGGFFWSLLNRISGQGGVSTRKTTMLAGMDAFFYFIV